MPKFLTNSRQIRNFAVIMLMSFVIGLPIISQPLGLLPSSTDPVPESTATLSETIAITADTTAEPAFTSEFEDYYALPNRGANEFAVDPDEAVLPDKIAGTEETSEPVAVSETVDPGDVTPPDEVLTQPTLSFEFEAAGYTVYIASGSLNVRSRPSADSASVGQLAFGDTAVCTGYSPEWLRIDFDGQNAYIYTEYTSRTMVFEDVNQTVYVTAGTLNLRESPSTDSASITKLSEDTRLTRTGLADGWSRVKTSSGKIGYVQSKYLTRTAPVIVSSTPSSPASSSGQTYGGDVGKLIDAAYSAIGVDYVYAGSSMSGFDCSGLVSWCYRQIGISVPRSTSGYYNIGVKVSYDELQPGDIICMDYKPNDGKTSITHVGIYVGDGMMIHASTGKDEVVRVGLAHTLKYCKLVMIRRMIVN